MRYFSNFVSECFFAIAIEIFPASLSISLSSASRNLSIRSAQSYIVMGIFRLALDYLAVGDTSSVTGITGESVLIILRRFTKPPAPDLPAHPLASP